MRDGTNHCEVDGSLKKLSFVFFATSDAKYSDVCRNDVRRRRVLEDGRGNKSVEGLFGGASKYMEVEFFPRYPAYLIVFEQ